MKETGDINGALVWADDPDGSGKDCMDCVASTHGIVLARAYRDAQARIAELEKQVKQYLYNWHGAESQYAIDVLSQVKEIRHYREALEKIRDDGSPDFDADDMALCARYALACYHIAIEEAKMNPTPEQTKIAEMVVGKMNAYGGDSSQFLAQFIAGSEAKSSTEIADYRKLLKKLWRSSRLQKPDSTMLDEIDSVLARYTHVYPKGTAPSEWEEYGQDKP